METTESAVEMKSGEVPEPTGCRNCGKEPTEPGYKVALCQQCRNVLAQRPLPKTITGAGAVVGLALLIAFARFPEALSTGIAYERGHRAEARHDYQAAVTQYQRVTARFPNSTQALGRLCVASFHAGQLDVTVDTLDQLKDREVSKELADEVKPIVGQLDALAKAMDKQESKGKARANVATPGAQGGAKP